MGERLQHGPTKPPPRPEPPVPSPPAPPHPVPTPPAPEPQPPTPLDYAPSDSGLAFVDHRAPLDVPAWLVWFTLILFTLGFGAVVGFLTG